MLIIKISYIVKQLLKNGYWSIRWITVGFECGVQQQRRWHVFSWRSASGWSRRWVPFQLASVPFTKHSSLWIRTAQCYNRLAGCSSCWNTAQCCCFLFEVSCFIRSWWTFARSSRSDAGIYSTAFFFHFHTEQYLFIYLIYLFFFYLGFGAIDSSQK